MMNEMNRSEIVDRQSIKDLKNQKQGIQNINPNQVAKGWLGSNLGSGQSGIARSNVNMALEPSRQEKPTPANISKKEQGWN